MKRSGRRSNLKVMKRRWLGCLAVMLAGGAMSVPLGPTTTQRAVDQMNASSMRGVPTPPVRHAPRQDMVWVPDRWVPAPGIPQGVFEPGHWVTYTPEGGRIAPPPPRPDLLQGP
jgi:hypothetical protein